jgi:hypothetical protein
MSPPLCQPLLRPTLPARNPPLHPLRHPQTRGAATATAFLLTGGNAPQKCLNNAPKTLRGTMEGGLIATCACVSNTSRTVGVPVVAAMKCCTVAIYPTILAKQKCGNLGLLGLLLLRWWCLFYWSLACACSVAAWEMRSILRPLLIWCK